MFKTITWVKIMNLSYLAPITFVALLSASQIVTANALTTDETKKIASSDATKVALSIVAPKENFKALHDLHMLENTQALAKVKGGLTGGTNRSLDMVASPAIK